VDLLDDEFARPGHPPELSPALYEPLSDFLSRPGKEFRARLVDLCWKLCTGHRRVPGKLDSIVEIVHAGSLIVDDIEDGSPLRRGRPALHIDYGVPTALNAGNWLYFWAYALIEQLDLGPHVELALYRRLSQTMARCHEGQALDLTVRMGQLSQRHVARVVEATTRSKTGALMGLSAAIPAVASGASHQASSQFQRFGEGLGVGLQMLDDLGGLTSERRCHKGHEDLLHGRPTWPWAWLAGELTEIDYLRLQQKAREVEARDLHPEALAEQLRKALGPQAKHRVFNHIVQTLRLLPRDLPGGHHMRELQDELARLMRSYD
jgi:geranylgeranyl pyrophosphate synthase